MTENDPFQNRCIGDPQDVIRDLISQTTRQAAEIHRLNLLLEGILFPADAAYMLKVLKSQPVTVSRDFANEDYEELLAKKLKIIVDSEEKKAKKAKKQ